MMLAISRAAVLRFRAIVAARLGLAFDDDKLAPLAEALGRRVDAGGNVDAYLDRLAAQSSAAEWGALARELTVAETYFFRNGDQFRAFADVALPQCAARRGAQGIRVLCAGCASGEEPYSLAMAAKERWPEIAGRLQITAIDVNPAMLEKARAAHYSAWSLRDTPAAARARWFRPSGTGFTLDAAIRDAVVFEERNLVSDDPELWQAQHHDIIFCRNVLMYFTPPQMQSVVDRIALALVPGGYLFLGHAETLRGLSTAFDLCHTHETFYYRHSPVAPAAERALQWWDARPMAAGAGAVAAPAEPPLDWMEAVQRASRRIDALAQAARTLMSAAPPEADRAPADLSAALDALRHEQFHRVLEQLDALPAEQRRDPQALLLRAVSLVQSGALAAAEAVCVELIERDGPNAGAHYLIALCREGSGDAVAAMEHDRIAIDLDPGFAMARLHFALLARRRNDHATARRELAQTLLRLQQEKASRLLLFGGGFGREALLTLCRAELAACARPA